MAQWIRRRSPKLKIASSSLAVGKSTFSITTIYKFKNESNQHVDTDEIVCMSSCTKITYTEGFDLLIDLF